MRREDLAHALADAVVAVPGVARLAPGGAVEVATHFSGGKVTGIRLGDPVEIHIEADRVPLPPVATKVIRAARRVLDAAGEPGEVRVVIDDVATSALERRRR